MPISKIPLKNYTEIVEIVCTELISDSPVILIEYNSFDLSKNFSDADNQLIHCVEEVLKHFGVLLRIDDLILDFEDMSILLHGQRSSKFNIKYSIDYRSFRIYRHEGVVPRNHNRIVHLPTLHSYLKDVFSHFDIRSFSVKTDEKDGYRISKEEFLYVFSSIFIDEDKVNL